jgi:hypothetical protein
MSREEPAVSAQPRRAGANVPMNLFPAANELNDKKYLPASTFNLFLPVLVNLHSSM